MSEMLVPNLFALSAMSTIAISAYFEAWTVSPPSPCNKLAEKEVTCSMYFTPEMPARLYAVSEFFITVPAESLKSVSTPPRACSSPAKDLITPPTAPATGKVKPAVIPAPTFSMESPTPLIVPLNFSRLEPV